MFDQQIQNIYAGFFKDNNLHVIIPIIVLMATVGGVCDYYRRKCPECRKKYGLERLYTENTVKGILGWFIKNDVDTYKCKYCGYVIEKPSNRE